MSEGLRTTPPHPQSPDECWCDECEAYFASRTSLRRALKKVAAETREMHRLYPFTRTYSPVNRRADRDQ